MSRRDRSHVQQVTLDELRGEITTTIFQPLRPIQKSHPDAQFNQHTGTEDDSGSGSSTPDVEDDQPMNMDNMRRIGQSSDDSTLPSNTHTPAPFNSTSISMADTPMNTSLPNDAHVPLIPTRILKGSPRKILNSTSPHKFHTRSIHSARLSDPRWSSRRIAQSISRPVPSSPSDLRFHTHALYSSPVITRLAAARAGRPY